MGRLQREATHSLAERAAGSRAWAERQVRERPVSTGLGLMALGFVSAALVPSSRAERRALARTSDAVKDLADRFEVARHFDDALRRAREIAALQLASALEERTAHVGVPRPERPAPRDCGSRRGR